VTDFVRHARTGLDPDGGTGALLAINSTRSQRSKNGVLQVSGKCICMISRSAEFSKNELTRGKASEPKFSPTKQLTYLTFSLPCFCLFLGPLTRLRIQCGSFVSNLTSPIQDMRKFHFFIDVASISYRAAYKIKNSLVNAVLHVPQIFENFWMVCVVASECCREGMSDSY
jgi:hypothetical protein